MNSAPPAKPRVVRALCLDGWLLCNQAAARRGVGKTQRPPTMMTTHGVVPAFFAADRLNLGFMVEIKQIKKGSKTCPEAGSEWVAAGQKGPRRSFRRMKGR
jgi:hypothetical protein